VPGANLGTLHVTQGGVSTSGRDHRRFGPGRMLHHLIDPLTGRPAEDGPLSVTVVARSATEAEAHSTALAVTAVADAPRYLFPRPQLSALVVPDDGAPVEIGALPLHVDSHEIEMEVSA
jgi:FAD:protein FMN transferase